MVCASIRPSGIHGVGCFTEEPIREGEVVWGLHEGLDVIVTAAELERQPAVIQRFLEIYGYVERRGGEEVVVLCGDHARHMNHSAEGNLVWDADRYVAVAVRDIRAGEELTSDYYTYDLHAAAKLSASAPLAAGTT